MARGWLIVLCAFGLHGCSRIIVESECLASSPWVDLLASVDPSTEDALERFSRGVTCLRSPWGDPRVLSDADLARSGLPRELGDLKGVAAVGDSSHPVDAFRPLQVDPDQTCLHGPPVAWAERTPISDAGCWEAGRCSTFAARTEYVEDWSFLGTRWYALQEQWRSFRYRDRKGSKPRAIVSRGWLELPAPDEAGELEGLVLVDVWLPSADPGTATERWSAAWMRTASDLDLEFDMLQRRVDEGLGLQEELLDLGDTPSCETERGEPRPEP